MVNMLWEKTAKGNLSEDPHGSEAGWFGPLFYSVASGTSARKGIIPQKG